MASEHKRLGDLLKEAGLLDDQQLAQAIEEHKRSGQMLGATLVKLGLVAEADLIELLHKQLRLPVVDLDQTVPDEHALNKVAEDLARKYVAIPIELNKKTLTVAMADPLNVAALEDLGFHAGLFIQPVLSAPTQIVAAIERHYHLDTSVNEVIQSIIQREDDIVVNAVQEEEEREAVDTLLKEAEGRPIVRLTNWLLHRAVEERASDIHIEPQLTDLVVRLRVDGLLREEQRLPKWTQSAIVSRIKVLANLDIAEKRQPQDGRLAIEIAGRRVDMRVSTLPLTNGEKVVMRIVDQRGGRVSLDAIGLDERDHARLTSFLERPQGIVLATGPTGSGKSTLLYAALRHLQDVTRNITTVEDPVEFQLQGINQVQVDEKAKKTFASALRSILRQDPDVIMIGEIRDQETAQIAFRASVTGHLVLSTVHTNDAAGAVTRLVDLGLEPFMVASALLGVVSIRLVRTICPRCREEYEVDASTLNHLVGHVGERSDKVTLYRGAGCPQCRESGYAGRTGIAEVLGVDDRLRALILRGAHDSEIRKGAIENGMRPIAEDGVSKILSGRTTLEEVSRVVYLAEHGMHMCPMCRGVVSKHFDYCPTCGTFVSDHCERCKQHLEPGWTFCPACGLENRARTGAHRPGDSRFMRIPAGARKAS